MTKDKSTPKSNPTVATDKSKQNNAAKISAGSVQKKQPSVCNENSDVYRLLIKIEIKNNITHNIMIPTPVQSSIQDLLDTVQKNFQNEIKCSSIYLGPQESTQSTESLYQVDKSFNIGQCFRDFDKVIIKADKVNIKSQQTTKDKKVQEAPKQPIQPVKKAEEVKRSKSEPTKKESKPEPPKKQSKPEPPKKEIKPQVVKQVKEAEITPDDSKKSNLTKNQKKRLQKAKRLEERKSSKSMTKEEVKTTEQPRKRGAKQVAKEEAKKVEKKPESLNIQKNDSQFTCSLPESPKKTFDLTPENQKLGKNAKRKLMKAEAEKQIRQKEQELKTLRTEIYKGINGYSQEEASKSISQESIQSEAEDLVVVKSSSESNPKQQVDTFLNKLNMIGKSKAQKAAIKTKEDSSDASSSFGSVDRISS